MPTHDYCCYFKNALSSPVMHAILGTCLFWGCSHQHLVSHVAPLGAAALLGLLTEPSLSM